MTKAIMTTSREQSKLVGVGPPLRPRSIPGAVARPSVDRGKVVPLRAEVNGLTERSPAEAGRKGVPLRVMFTTISTAQPGGRATFTFPGFERSTA
jgi:hypothetical protein